MGRILGFVASHALVGALGFALGIYLLPILAAPPSPTASEISGVESAAVYQAEFRRDLAGSDALHWGEGKVSIGPRAVALNGALAPEPAYRLYLSPEFVDTEEQFLRVRQRMLPVGEIRTFDGFVVELPAVADLSAYNSVVVWCEAFDEFITAAQYR